MCDALTAEMWMMLHETELAWRNKIINLVIESDSKVLIDMFNQEIGNNHNFSILDRRIIRMTDSKELVHQVES